MRLIDADKMTADLLTVDPQYETMIKWCLTVLDAQPTIEERKIGRWLEKEVFHEVESSTPIEQWQSAKCSNCGKYHTTPYLYYFEDYAYCPHCGAKMEVENK